jgi:carbon-monoxide dehydrogenase small subunit
LWVLLYLVGFDLGVRGTLWGCGWGECGACTVHLDGLPVYACSTLALDARGHAITTIEGLSRDGELAPIQRAFVEEGAIQCGYCTPGMIMAAQALLLENPTPSQEEVRAALQGNLCRCTGYQKILRAVERCAAENRRLGKGGGQP